MQDKATGDAESQGRFERFCIGSAMMLTMVSLLFSLCSLCGGCRTADCGSRTVVGSHTALPKLSSDASDLDVEVYESTEGAVVYTRKDSRVEIAYTNVYTNTLLGVWDRCGVMVLGVIIEPTEAAAPLADAPCANEERGGHGRGSQPCEVVDGRGDAPHAEPER